jgi:hypothetical protein
MKTCARKLRGGLEDRLTCEPPLDEPAKDLAQLVVRHQKSVSTVSAGIRFWRLSQ